MEPLTDEEARELESMRPMPESAKRRLVESQLSMVVEIASGFPNSDKHVLDLIQAGSTGLIEAVETFAGSGSGRFAEYARTCVERQIRQSISEDQPK